MGKKLTQAQIERYHREGFVYPIDAFAAEDARRYRRAMEEFETAQGRELGKGHNFIPTTVRCASRTRVTAMLVRGTDRHGHFDDEPRPHVDFGWAERAAHAGAVARFRASNAEQTTRYAAALR